MRIWLTVAIWATAVIDVASCSPTAGADFGTALDGAVVADDVPAVAVFEDPANDIEALTARMRALEATISPRAFREPKRSAGWSGGAELMFFRPCATARSLAMPYVEEAGFQPAWRLWGGVSGVEGFGLDVRWWQYDQTNDLVNHARGADLVFQKLDVVVNQRLGFHGWDTLLFAGPTYAGNGLRNAGPDTPPNAPARWRFDGAGLTGGLQVLRGTPWLQGVSVAASLQGSAVFGPSVMPGGIYTGRYSQASTCAAILELSFGPRWERRLRGGATAFAGGACEAQYWSTGLGSQATYFFPSFGYGGGDIGLIGFTCNVGVRR